MTYTIETPAVFGSGRRDAAILAIRELNNARAAYEAAPVAVDWSRDPIVEARLREAEYNRANYPEYADSFAGEVI